MCCKPGWFWCIYCTISSVVLFGFISSIIFWIVISPSSVKFYVTNVALTEFNLTNNNLYYNFKLNITARNPNNNIVVYYRRIIAIAWYKDNEFSYVSLAPFDQGHKNTTFLGPIVFKGNNMIKLGRKQLDEYSEETRLGIYEDLAVDLDVRIRAKFGRFRSGRFNPPVVQCRRLRIPLISSSNVNSSSTHTFSNKRCSSGSFFTDRDADAGD
ncbi:NDR1/HIN1-like protein 10 [Cicer arietinum]|uniref:NDR1/HIN1-like protein 10 n=1 Tax=Cicer arietinum TaxID=3827 RepID=A0A3Q7XHP4_CICAR|nr:NDR1/HIN1-like protein 10 [Cicer arietinum]